MAPRSERRSTVDTVFDRRNAPRQPSSAASEQPQPGAPSERKRRATRDGREPLVVYMLPEDIKALKIAAVEQDTTASAIVADAVTRWLAQVGRRAART